MTAVIRYQQVSKYYRRRPALRDFSLEVPAGSVFALLGENGAGKSTAIKLLLGLTAPTAGSVEALGLDPGRHSLELRRRIGYVPDSPALYDWMSVAEIGWFAAGFYPDTDGFLAHYRQLTSEFALAPKSRIAALSKGMQAKVSLSLALAARPELLVMDEPTLGLDPIVRREFLESMIDVAAEGRTVLLSSHQINEVERVADWVAVLREGVLVCVERLEDLKEQTREVWITCDTETPLPAVSGVVLRSQRRGRQWRLLVRGQPAELEQLGQLGSVDKVEWRTPSLEDIFVALSRPLHSETGIAIPTPPRKGSPA